MINYDFFVYVIPDITWKSFRLNDISTLFQSVLDSCEVLEDVWSIDWFWVTTILMIMNKYKK